MKMRKNFSKNFKSGFTLIELLVVVAIIGILASVMIGSLRVSRAKGVDAAIKANLVNIRSQAELFYITGNVYTNLCADPIVVAQLNAIASALKGTVGATNAAVTATTVSCHESVNAWAAGSGTQADNTKYWCVDSLGASKLSSTALALNATMCP